ncbi:MAG: hypothetical protein M1834_001118 [Cirrosporium novae-zelandiae]|nr:MAG: hypothetical protein M1834_001118 [Cirrosporium novae-zelandiae]
MSQPFKRLKGAIDARIAEEQARQRATQSPPPRSNSARRTNSRTASPRRTRTRRENGEQTRAPDPAEFETTFTVGDEDPLSRATTPKPSLEKSDTTMDTDRGLPGQTPGLGNKDPVLEESGVIPVLEREIPTDVKVKLRRLEKLEPRYNDLLNAYRVAHARVQSIEPFETTLRENTPLTSITEPQALVEYLNQQTLKVDMYLEELKRVTADRDAFKLKLEDAEKKTKEAFDDVARLKKEAAEKPPQTSQAQIAIPNHGPPVTSQFNSPALSENPLSPSIKPRHTSFPGMSLFSPKPKPEELAESVEQNESGDLFSFDEEVPRLQAELKARQIEVGDLQIEVKTLKSDLEVARESTESMAQSLESAGRELNILKDQKDRQESEMQTIRSNWEMEKASFTEKVNSSQEKVQDLEQEKRKLVEQISSLKAEMDKLQAANKPDGQNKTEDEQNQERLSELSNMVDTLKLKLRDAESQSENLRKLEEQKSSVEAELERLKAAEISKPRNSPRDESNAKRVSILTGVVDNLKRQLKDAENKNEGLKLEISKKENATRELRDTITQLEVEVTAKSSDAHNRGTLPTAIADSGSQSTKKPAINTASSARRKKKNRKGGKGPAAQTNPPEQGHVSPPSNPPTVQQTSEESRGTMTEVDGGILDLQQEITELKLKIQEKDRALEEAYSRRKNEADLQEEIEELRYELINVGQEHVEAKDKIKSLQSEKTSLETSLRKVETELAEMSAKYAEAASSSEAHESLTAEFEDLRIKATTLQTDLSAAQELAASRFKQMTDLREALQKAQPELRSLRNEVAGLRAAKDELNQRNSEIRRLESRNEDLSTELIGLKNRISDRETDVKTLNQKIEQELSNRLKAEQYLSTKVSELKVAETKRQDAVEARDQNSRDLAKAQEELRNCRGQLRELEEKVVGLTRDANGLRDEIQLKTAQHASAQSLMSSMRDQTSEIATQMKEARERCENLEEELTDAHRLLSERSREGETMRRLLADAEGRTEIKLREMRERLDAALEERDRAEDEASAASRRRAREMDDMKNKVRETERSLKLLEEEKEELESAQREWRRRREELEAHDEQSSKELHDVRRAMGELRDALDASEKQAGELERQKTELRKAVEESTLRVEKLQKTNKIMTEEVRSLQTSKKVGRGSEAPSTRSSIDSPSSRSLVGSPTPNGRGNSRTVAVESSSSQSSAGIDLEYLKNVLLQFLEQKDKKHKQQLIPVLSMLLRFDGKDEQKWMSVVTAL